MSANGGDQEGRRYEPADPGNPMEMGIKHRIGNGNGREWELPALPWEFIPKGFMLR